MKVRNGNVKGKEHSGVDPVSIRFTPLLRRFSDIAFLY